MLLLEVSLDFHANDKTLYEDQTSRKINLLVMGWLCPN